MQLLVDSVTTQSRVHNINRQVRVRTTQLCQRQVDAFMLSGSNLGARSESAKQSWPSTPSAPPDISTVTPSSHSQGTRSLCHRTPQEVVGDIWVGVLNAEIGRCSCTSGGLNAHVDTHTLKAELCLQRSRVQLERVELVEPAVSELVQRCGGSNCGGQQLSRRHQAQTSVFARPRSAGPPSLVVL